MRSAQMAMTALRAIIRSCTSTQRAAGIRRNSCFIAKVSHWNTEGADSLRKGVKTDEIYTERYHEQPAREVQICAGDSEYLRVCNTVVRQTDAVEF